MKIEQFCSARQARPALSKPFSIGDWTYATDGRLLVRVPRLADVPEDPKAPAANKLPGLEIACDFVPAPKISLPPATEAGCTACDGRGSMHDCPSCECPCEDCDGSGVESPYRNISFGYGCAVFGARYIALIKDLPGLMFGKPSEAEAMRFRFDGGEGLIMPMTGGKCAEHIVLPLGDDSISKSEVA